MKELKKKNRNYDNVELYAAEGNTINVNIYFIQQNGAANTNNVGTGNSTPWWQRAILGVSRCK